MTEQTDSDLTRTNWQNKTKSDLSMYDRTARFRLHLNSDLQAEEMSMPYGTERFRLTKNNFGVWKSRWFHTSVLLKGLVHVCSCTYSGTGKNNFCIILSSIAAAPPIGGNTVLENIDQAK